jgi:DNA-binding transcriptional LysR family regulator
MLTYRHNACQYKFSLTLCWFVMIFDARELAILKLVIEKGSVTAAASMLNISQPAVSRTLQQIEHRLGIELFRREKQRLYATREAEALYDDVVHAVAAVDTVARHARDLKEGRSGALRIASIASFANSILPRAIGRFRRSNPEVEFVIEVMSAREVAQRVATFRSELGLLIDTAPISGISIEELCTSRFGCLLPEAHPLASQASLSIRDIAAERLICLSRSLPLGALANRIFERHDLALRPVAEVSQSSVACALVESGVGLALVDKLGLLTADALMKKVSFVPLEPEEMIVGRLVLPVQGSHTVSARDFCNTLKDLVREIAATDPDFKMPVTGT